MPALAAVSQSHKGVPSSIAPQDRPMLDRRIGAVRAAMGDPVAFDRAWQEGRAMRLEQAIELAVEETVESPQQN